MLAVWKVSLKQKQLFSFFPKKLLVLKKNKMLEYKESVYFTGSGHRRQKTQAPTPRAPIRNRQTRKVSNAKVLNHNTNLT